MKFGKSTTAQKANGVKAGKTIIHYNGKVKFTNIPLEACDYVVNGKPALEWIIDRYYIKTDKNNGITNAPNDWCCVHDNPRYIIDFLKTVCYVSSQTNNIVANLPALNEITK